MKQEIKAFFTRHNLPALLLAGALIAAVPAAAIIQGLRVTKGFRMSMQAASVESIPETVVVITEPTTEPMTEPPTEPPTTEPPTTEPPPPPEEILLEDVPYYTQHGLLPTGCELVSAKMLLEYYTEEPVDIQEIIDRMDCQYPQTIDGVPCAPHPSEAFIGSPWDPTSFGCFSPIICDMMNDLLPDDCIAVDTTGTPLQELAETYLPQGRPVLVWATIAMYRSFPHMGWYLMDEHGKPTDEWYDWLANEHCLVLIGYDENYYYFNDPYAWSACTKYSRDIVETRFEEMDRYSAVVLDCPPDTQKETYVIVRTTEPETTEPPETTDPTETTQP